MILMPILDLFYKTTMSCSLKMCCTCLEANENELIDIKDTDSDHLTYLDKLRACIPINMDDNTLTKICEPCVKQLRISYDFREMVLISQEAFQKFLERIKQEDSGEVDRTSKTSGRDSGELLDTPMYMKDEYRDEKQSVHELSYIKQLLKEVKRERSVKSELSNGNTSDNDDDYAMEEKTESEDDLNSTYLHQCSKCNEEFLKLKELRAHKCPEAAENDTKESQYSENESKTRRRRGRAKKYVKKVKPDVDYECEYCAVKFNKRWKLQKHKNRVHSEDKKYICTYCNKAFKQSYHLREHLTSHTGERNYTCSFCGKSFQRVSSMRRHIRSHEAAPGQKTKRTPFLCTVCGKSFPFSNGVQRHMRIHLGIKNHECTVCNRKFTQSTHLHVHMRTHTGEKPYICDTCGEAFSLNASLQKHMAVHETVDNKTSLSEELAVFLVRR